MFEKYVQETNIATLFQKKNAQSLRVLVPFLRCFTFIHVFLVVAKEAETIPKVPKYEN